MSFDRAADFYDTTRALPVDVHDRLTTMLLTELSARPLCLEIGVGTGRIALPLVERGVSMIGVDIAPKMLRRLVVNAGGRSPFRCAWPMSPRCPSRPVSSMPLWPVTSSISFLTGGPQSTSRSGSTSAVHLRHRGTRRPAPF